MSRINHVMITPMSTEQIVKLSSVQITNVQLLQDGRMGATQGRCLSCNLYAKQCYGHYGCIPLAFPVFSALISEMAVELLKNVCLNCLRLPFKFNDTKDLNKQIKQLKNQKSVKKCPHCKTDLERFTIEFLAKGKIVTKIPLYVKCNKFQAYRIKKLLTGVDMMNKGSPDIVALDHHIVNKILVGLIQQSEARAIVKYNRLFECFMIQALPVPPNSMRVLTQQTQGHAMNSVYTAILNAMSHLKDIQSVDDLYLPAFEPHQQLMYMRIIVGCRVALSKDTSRNSKLQTKQLLLNILNIATQEPASALSQCLTKKGWFRTYVSSVRVNMSARTVVVGDPWIDIDQVVIPKFFAQTLFVPITVNNDNIMKLKALINNYPNYPCALKRMFNGISFAITNENKQLQTSQLQIGDIVKVQLLDNMVVMVNRYPTLREESFTALRCQIEDTKTIKFNLGVINKMTCDFDGDEVEIFALGLLADCMEALNLYSPARQFNTYETGLNIIGGNGAEQDIYPGIFHLQNEKFRNRQFLYLTEKDDDEEINGIQLVQMAFEKLIYKNDDRLKRLTYKDKNIYVENGVFKEISVDLAASKSKFLTFVSFHHSQQKAILIINVITRLAYNVNHVSASTIMTNVILTKEQKDYIKNIDDDRMRTLQDITNQYYTGRISAPAGFDLRTYYEKLYQDRLQDYEILQRERVYKDIQVPGTNFLNHYYKEAINKVMSAVGHLGQQMDQGQRILPDPYYERSMICFSKFESTPQSEGYVKGNFMEGLTQAEMFMNATAERRAAYVKGNSTAISGYLARRINQGAGNMYSAPNGIILSDGDQVVSLQYGFAGYDPRCFVVLPFDKHHISMEEFDKQYKDHPRYDEMIQIRKDLIAYENIFKRINPTFQSFDTISTPFEFDQKDVSEVELDKLFACRLTSKMSLGFKEIIVSQVYNFYIYALFFLKINKDSKHDIVKKYLQCMVQIGEPVGMKAALACSQPYTQGMLHAIHSKGGSMSMIQEERTDGVTRFQELVIGNNGPAVIQFQLLGKMKYDQKRNIEFVTKYQTIMLNQLDPQIVVQENVDRYCGKEAKIKKALKNVKDFENGNFSNYIIQVRMTIKQMAYYNVNLMDVMTQICAKNTQIKQIVPYVEDKCIYFMIYTINGISKQQVVMIKSYLMETQVLGSKYFYNMYYTPFGKEFKIIANITNKDHETQSDVLLKIALIRGVDHETIYCSEPKEFENLCGILKSRLSMYTELATNLSTDKATKMVQYTHVKQISDQLTCTGKIGSYTRNYYRVDDARDTIGTMLFEQGDYFLSLELMNPQRQILSTMLNSCIYGTRCDMGSTVSVVLFDSALQQQDEKKLLTMMDK